jgi:glucan phosphoethanolaminetransferase (alkaline phosphatase superfamily)
MIEDSRPIEEIFLASMLKICLAGILIVMTADFYFTKFSITRSVVIDIAILFAVLSAFWLSAKGYFKLAVLWIGTIISASMYYQSIAADSITTSSMAVIMVVGFGFSILLKGRLPIILHSILLVGMIAVFSWLALHPQQYGKNNANDIMVAGVTYTILYFVITYSSWIMKKRYDAAFKSLADKNLELYEKSNEIETQNEELVQSQESLNQLNLNLENLVQERTQKIQQQNYQLIKYAYSNAHHVRGPVARILGLIQLSKMENINSPFLFQKIEDDLIEKEITKL